ncbi:MAG: ribokinase [Propionicimonas sp.]|uniref:ribokinase n=1 Tax=Propionicimonas sp. TaxID=1955623 RepID=UPI002B1F6D58|nr:ribokinase [Propionicimonas sp.]MEA4945225.1 ribokinase [Propionicimonas sp.]MEA5117210.1 ribokinase [Propionicimonas sp.]
MNIDNGSRAAIGVLGSANMDLVVRVAAPPRPGETIFGSSFITVPGGKGLNQAVAAARAGGRVSFIGTVGTDGYGTALADLMTDEGMDVGQLRREGITGTAHITVDAEGQNSIIVVSAANLLTSADQVTDEVLDGLGWLVTQLELDLATVQVALARAHAAGVRTVLTPAPARPLSAELLRTVDLLVPNELEACMLADRDDPLEAAQVLSELCRDVVVTLGGDGAALASGGRITARIPGRRVEALDTTAAGDTFVGVLTTLLAEGADLPEALQVATVAASISVTRSGATSSMPTRAEIDAAR